MKAPLSIYCDFDGTVTLKDTTDFLLERLADERWQDYEAQWERGEIGSRECMKHQIPLMKGGWQAIESLLGDVRLDPTFRQFAAWCHSQKIPLFIVSEGIDRVIGYLLKRDGIRVNAVWANHLEESPTGELSLSFPSAPASKECQAGLCKCQVLSQAPLKTKRVVIGDGLSDLCWAGEADMLFAKSKLLNYCIHHQIGCTPFQDFNVIQMALENYLAQPPKLVPLRFSWQNNKEASYAHYSRISAGS